MTEKAKLTTDQVLSEVAALRDERDELRRLVQSVRDRLMVTMTMDLGAEAGRLIVDIEEVMQEHGIHKGPWETRNELDMLRSKLKVFAVEVFADEYPTMGSLKTALAYLFEEAGLTANRKPARFDVEREERE